MKQIFTYLMIYLFSVSILAQDTISKKNPILFADLYTGLSTNILGLGGFGGVGLNYQLGSNLFTLRYSESSHTSVGTNIFLLGVFGALLPYQEIEKTEFALLYGQRWIKNSSSSSISVGLSYERYQLKDFLFLDKTSISSESVLGFPFEFNVKWFKSEKSKFRILYGLVPVGNPTGYSGSFGLKLYGNISKYSEVGIGIVYGLGFHKEY